MIRTCISDHNTDHLAAGALVCQLSASRINDMTAATRSMATHRSEVNRCSTQDLLMPKNEMPNSEPKYAVHTALSSEGGNYYFINCTKTELKSVANAGDAYCGLNVRPPWLKEVKSTTAENPFDFSKFSLDKKSFPGCRRVFGSDGGCDFKQQCNPCMRAVNCLCGLDETASIKVKEAAAKQSGPSDTYPHFAAKLTVKEMDCWWRSMCTCDKATLKLPEVVDKGISDKAAGKRKAE